LRSAAGRAAAFSRNLEHIRALFAEQSEHFAVVRTRTEYDRARAQGRHAAMLVIQGGNAIDHDAQAIDALDAGDILRVTLVHLSSSSLGTTSSPLRVRRDAGLSSFAKQYIEALDARRIFVDLAHIGRRSFFDAVEVHDKSLPLIVTHTGVSAVTASWRNLDDEQLRAVAATGGTVGVIFNGPYIGWSLEGIVEHLAHIVRTVGEDHASIGSDYDGAIVPPRALRSCVMLPRLVAAMLEHGFSPDVVQKILGGNFLRAFAALRA
jgi:membrane dipeptidase